MPQASRSIAGVKESTTLSTKPAEGRDDVPRPTMRDVAALARVGLKTVSRVINGEPGVSSELRHRVLRATDQLDYRPNLTASSLRRTSGKTATVGTILENVANPFSAALQRAVEDVARARGVLVFASSADEDAERERILAASFVAHRVDGLIVVPAGPDQGYLATEARAGIALVFVDRPPHFLDADAVLSSNRRGANEGVSHLIAHGHRRIAFIGDLPTIFTAMERYSGYAEALAAAGLPIDPQLVVTGVRSAEDAAEATVAVLNRADPPTALFTAQNLVTEGSVTVMRALGRRHDVAVVGFDDFPMAEAVEPRLTVIAQDVKRLGATAAELLFRRLDGDRGPTQTIVVPTRLIVRGSGEIPGPG
jgi:LacI family transcriptional regulator